MGAIRSVFKFGTGPWDPTNRFETSWLLTPWVFLTCRAAIALYAFTALFFELAWTCIHRDLGGCPAARRSFSYFTVLSFWGIACYFTVAAVHTLSYILSAGGRRHATLLARLPRPFQALHALVQTSILTLPLLVTLVFWSIIYDSSSRRRSFANDFATWRTITGHVLNSVFALFELLFSRVEPPPAIHLLWLLVILLGYLGLAFVTVSTQGFYPYSFLDPTQVDGRGYVATSAFIVGLALVGLYMLVRGMVALRRWVTETKLDMGGKFVTARRRRGQDMELGAVHSLGKTSRRDQYNVL